MEIYTTVKKNTYQDSMKLMQLQAYLNRIPGVISCGVAMATPINKSQFREAGLLTQQVQEGSPNDLCIVVKAESKAAISVARVEIDRYFSPKERTDGYPAEVDMLPKSLFSALKQVPNANLTVISVPGEYAALEATKALNNGLHVFLFSDNVPIEDELELKALAKQKGLLMMGPDCGTAIISGIPLGFSNAVKPGRIGIVGASGSGMQEVCCLIHRMGEGISQAVGTGGRDLYNEVGGKTFITAMESLLDDEETDVIILMSKHCDEKVASRMVEKARESKKPIVAYFPGSDSLIKNTAENIYRAMNLEHIASSSVKLVRGNTPPKPMTKEIVSREMRGVITSESSNFSPEQKYVRAFFTGGTFADEANLIFPSFFDRVYSHPSFGQTLSLDNPLKSKEHCIVDLGDDFFTKGKLHPMIDPRLRVERIAEEIEDKQIKVFLLDVVLGYGAHTDPGGELTGIISDAKRTFEDQDGYLSFIVSLCGTEEDPQNYNEQKRKLEKSGAVVADSSTRAAILAGLIGSQ
jgi:FdrA protein